MYLNDVTNVEVENFIKKYVKDIHVMLGTCYENAEVEIVKMTRTNSSINLTTVIKDNNGYLEERWLLTPYKGIEYKNFSMNEIKRLTKEWSIFIYETLSEKNKEKAEEYKKSFIEFIKFEKDQKIESAKETYNDLVF